ncbi:leukocyte elastase inhibitor-like [Notolabrus celidotus]|uniref:leukocyte elastase inhibitor-like n=1 Tax=Notolabrus celidotus TaxID=1203425 RepID=UPI00148F7F09|nr:leukocyte elastase inhibitor-like [Notolabrus celidotus]
MWQCPRDHGCVTVKQNGVGSNRKSLSVTESSEISFFPQEQSDNTMASPSTSLAKANSTFFLALFKKLSDEDKTKNIFYSPLSISSALAMVLLGARGSTAAQMSEVMGFSGGDQPKESGEQSMEQEQMQMRMPLPKHLQSRGLQTAAFDDDIHAKFGRLLSELNKPDASYALSVANRLYGEKSFQFVTEFLADVKKYYSAELEAVDFRTKAEEARVNINTWVEENTQGKIKDLLIKGSLSDMTKLVLVNAIYFKGKWNKPFEKDMTVDYLFRMNKTDTKPVKMMQLKSKFSYSTIPEVNSKVLEMPYEKSDLSMIIFLPDDIEDNTTGLEKLEKELTHQNFVNWTRPDRMFKGEVEVKLPRFKMTETYSMKDILKQMGMSDVFTSSSDFSGMTPSKGLLLSKVVHKSFVDVNEEGTEAAASTGIVMELTSINLMTPTFIADHPFLFFIKHNATKTVLFAGRYCSPPE